MSSETLDRSSALSRIKAKKNRASLALLIIVESINWDSTGKRQTRGNPEYEGMAFAWMRAPCPSHPLPADAERHMFRLCRGNGGALVIVVVIREAVCQPPNGVVVPKFRVEVSRRRAIVG
jgi:hypothetical protein